MPFALLRFVANDCAALLGDLRCSIARVVVVNVNCGARQLLLKRADYLSDRRLLVVTGDQDGDVGISQIVVRKVVFVCQWRSL